jgi:16S rRNA (guanine(527)-N(7))-methyltransferase RsmG
VPDERLERWLDELLATPGLTAIRNRQDARRMLLGDSLRGVELVRRFGEDVVDVGSGGGAPGIPLAAALPDHEVVLLESQRRKCRFLERVAGWFPNVRVVCGRAEEQPPDSFGVAVAKALAPPPVAAEWCLALVRPGGAAVLWVGPTADAAAVARVLTHPFFSRPPPKSLDRNAFAFVNEELTDVSVRDGAATLAALTAKAVGCIVPHLPRPPRSWIVAGGGARNRALMRMLADELSPALLETAEQVGWSADALEAQAFAYLAVRTLHGLPITFPTTTGVARPLTGGIVATPSRDGARTASGVP